MTAISLSLFPEVFTKADSVGRSFVQPDVDLHQTLRQL